MILRSSMKKKNLIIYSFGLLILVSVIFMVTADKDKPGDEESSPSSASLLEAIENNFDFSKVVMGDGKVSHKFELQNKGTEPVKIKKVYTSCMCTQAVIIDSQGNKRGVFGMPGHGLPSRAKVEVGPGETVYVEAIFDPAAHGPSGVGLVQRSIYLETDSAKAPKVELKFTALVVR